MMTGGKVLPAIQVDLIGRSLQNNVPMQYVSIARDRRARFLLNNNNINNRSTVEVSGARKCLFGPSDPVETQKLYEECVENGRQRLINNYDFDIFSEKFCRNSAKSTSCAAINECDGSSGDFNNQISKELVNDKNCDTTIVQNGRLGIEQQQQQQEQQRHQEQYEQKGELHQQQHNQGAMNVKISFDKMCNVKSEGLVATKHGNNLKRSYPFTKITDYFPKTKIASTKKA